MKAIFVTMILAALLVTGCGSNQKHLERQQATEHWEALIRWSEFDALIDMIHPEWLEANPVTPLELDRLQQFRVTEYRVRRVLSEPDQSGFERQVQIRMYHVHTAHERVIDHREVWRYDEDLERWMLHSGLPDPRRR